MLVSCRTNVSNETTINLYVANSDVSKLTLEKADIPKENLEEIISETIKRNDKCFNPNVSVKKSTPSN